MAYMEGSAGSVGRIMAPLLGVPERHHADYGRLGLAFQHANFIRDVAEDCRLDRIYLPLRTASASASRRRTSGGESASPELRALVEHEVARARALFAAAAPAVAAAPATVRPGIRLACAVYESVLDRVEAARLRRARAPHGRPLLAAAAARLRGAAADDPPRHAARGASAPRSRARAPTS